MINEQALLESQALRGSVLDRTDVLDRVKAHLARTQPVENPGHTDAVSFDDRIDQRITHILGKTVVPMFTP
ncbi:hypothetical protein [Streptomyces sp. 4N124]|uniref:hypothetical protein n=1 Tax=Streptomyces sp. 4N124 TaxID=3457420 RepID=UPI003FD259FD